MATVNVRVASIEQLIRQLPEVTLFAKNVPTAQLEPRRSGGGYSERTEP
jgi:hypothetical protein